MNFDRIAELDAAGIRDFFANTGLPRRAAAEAVARIAADPNLCRAFRRCLTDAQHEKRAEMVEDERRDRAMERLTGSDL